jgi:hypothetical protein
VKECFDLQFQAGECNERKTAANAAVAFSLIYHVLIVLSICDNAQLSTNAAPKAGESAQLILPNTKVTAAQQITSGEFTPPGRTNLKGIPAFCRVEATLTPSSDSDIRIEVWLPLSGWNGKYRGQGMVDLPAPFSFDAMAGAIKLLRDGRYRHRSQR